MMQKMRKGQVAVFLVILWIVMLAVYFVGRVHGTDAEQAHQAHQEARGATQPAPMPPSTPYGDIAVYDVSGACVVYVPPECQRLEPEAHEQAHAQVGETP